MPGVRPGHAGGAASARDLTRGFLRLAFYGGLTATAVEYAVHFFYDKLLGVMFWDYSGTHMDLNRRVCVPFA